MMIRSSVVVISLFMLWLLTACQKSGLEDNRRSYIFIGHCYDWAHTDKVDPRIEKIDFSAFDGIWLGGDICRETTANKATLDYLHELFDLKNPQTKWAIGNHDFRNGHFDYIIERTERDLFYTHTEDDICYIVMNSFTEHAAFVDSCDEKQKQVELFSLVLDTISQSAHLVILMHNLLWANVDPLLTDEANASINAPGSWMDMLCDDHSKFQDIYYEPIKKVQERGVQVTIISGDGGQYDKAYQSELPNGIRFFISGINNSFDHSNTDLLQRFNTDPDSILIFKQDRTNRTLKGEFVQLNDYLQNQ